MSLCFLRQARFVLAMVALLSVFVFVTAATGTAIVATIPTTLEPDASQFFFLLARRERAGVNAFG